ncbi:hypothetical protein Acr_04g0007850 [Actinidia rufa]|uniref:Uncharacterized protein n=1 Tax=Actinidia rufa TaxID=165716 RepID=A0A7J0EK92_9ERIC|nr:hypothetical protein Acr_04g0007850 [Actinidia rufa]
MLKDHDGLRIFGPLAGPAHIRRPTQNQVHKVSQAQNKPRFDAHGYARRKPKAGKCQMMDADMMEEETATPPTPMPEMTLNSDQGDGGGGDAVRDLLALARQLIDQGKPSQALQSDG